MPPHMKVSKETKASIDCSEMDAQLESLRRRNIENIQPVRFSVTSDRSSTRFLIGHGRGPVLDSACDLLPPDRRPIPPQPNCPQSMKIYEEHMKLAAEFVQMQTEMTELRQYKAELAEKIKENQEIIDMKSPSLEEVQQYNRLTEEKDALLAFKEKLSEQLALIEEAQMKKAGSAHSSQGSNASEGWVVVNSKPPERSYYQ